MITHLKFIITTITLELFAELSCIMLVFTIINETNKMKATYKKNNQCEYNIETELCVKFESSDSN